MRNRAGKNAPLALGLITCALLWASAPALAATASSAKKAPAKSAAKTAPKSTVAKSASRKTPAIRNTAPESDPGGMLSLKSSAALVVDYQDGRTLYAKNTDAVAPIASITKLMTAMVVLDRELPLDEPITVDAADVDTIKNTHSRLTLGTTLTRAELLRLALMASENRAAAALGRAYPGGIHAFVAAMNHKAAELGMARTHFNDSTGLSNENVSTAQDLTRMVRAAYRYPVIREYTTTTEYWVEGQNGRSLQFRNSNGLVKSSDWTIGLSKTGYISEAGRCLVMQAEIAARPVIIVLLDSWGKYTRIGDANRIKKWMESAAPHTPKAASGTPQPHRIPPG